MIWYFGSSNRINGIRKEDGTELPWIMRGMVSSSSRTKFKQGNRFT
ncbi:MAG: hypothetical protein IPH84_14290 [Bacteroidales bacterium]|nr:hypothetical protein [Bacteroidales bacterium]